MELHLCVFVAEVVDAFGLSVAVLFVDMVDEDDLVVGSRVVVEAVVDRSALDIVCNAL